jgi:hypothetical protein
MRIVCVPDTTGFGVICCRSIRSRAGGVRSAILIGPVPVGQPVAGGAGAVVTTADGADVTAFDPLAFVPVTLTRSVLPASAVTTVYVLWVALAMLTHAPPVASQRDQRYANVMPVPVYVPGFAVSDSPTTAEPEIVGGAVFGGPACTVTCAVAFDTATRWASGFVAVTRTRSRNPTSPAATTYVVLVAPSMVAQSDPSDAPPDGGHRSHWYANVGAGSPVQVPGAAVSV